MKEFCNSITVIPVDTVQSVQNGVIHLKSGVTTYTFSTDDFEITPLRQDTESGSIYEIEQDITVDKVSKAAAQYFSILRSVIYELKLTGWSPGMPGIHIGSLELPAKASVTTHLQKDTLHMKCKSFQSPL
jgi:hypothetical protein